MEEPTKAHYHAAQNVMIYLNGTREKGLVYHRSDKLSQPEIIGYTDADFAVAENRRSYSGCCFNLSKNNSNENMKIMLYETYIKKPWYWKHIYMDV